jgi:hypothetical protein
MVMLSAATNDQLDARDARDLTERIKQSVDRVWDLLLDAYSGRAWEALGYRGWGAYVTAEFDISPRRAYQLLDQARTERALQEAAQSSAVTIGERRARAVKSVLPAVTAAVRLRVVEEPEARACDVVDEVVEEHRREPERAARRARSAKPAPSSVEELPSVFDPARDDAAQWVMRIVQGLGTMPSVDVLLPHLPTDRTFSVPLPAAAAWLRALAVEGRSRCPLSQERSG